MLKFFKYVYETCKNTINKNVYSVDNMVNNKEGIPIAGGRNLI